MAELHVVSALRDKRSEVSGLIADLERRIAQQRADLVHVDAVLRLYAPDLEAASIAVRAVRRDHGWFKRGELSRLVLDVLRITPVPMTLKAIATEVMARRQSIRPTNARFTGSSNWPATRSPGKPTIWSRGSPKAGW